MRFLEEIRYEIRLDFYKDVRKVFEFPNLHSIAQGGEELRKKCYNLQRNVDRYNASVKNRHDALFLNPYKENVDDYILDDEHHLNVSG